MKRMIVASYQDAFELELRYPEYEIRDDSDTIVVDIYRYGPYDISIDSAPAQNAGVGTGRYTYTVLYNPNNLKPEIVPPDNIVDVNYYGEETYDKALQKAVAYCNKL